MCTVEKAATFHRRRPVKSLQAFQHEICMRSVKKRVEEDLSRMAEQAMSLKHNR